MNTAKCCDRVVFFFYVLTLNCVLYIFVMQFVFLSSLIIIMIVHICVARFLHGNLD